MSNDKLEVPETGVGDHLHTTVKAALGVIPLAGGALAELFSAVIESPFQKRKHEWMNRVVEAIQDLQKSGIQIDTLKENDAFISAVFYASHLAMKTHQEEKLEALQNAIENVALNIETDEVLHQMYLNYIDTLTVMHIKLLKFAKSPTPNPDYFMTSLESALYAKDQRLKHKRGLVYQVWKELYNNGLVSVDTLVTTQSNVSLQQSFLTGLGEGFLTFISKKG